MAGCPNGYIDCSCGGCSNTGCSHCYAQEGCPDQTAVNYNNGCSEEFPCLSCNMDSYPPIDTSCCIMPEIGCTDRGATNFDGDSSYWLPCNDPFPNYCCDYECQYDSDCASLEFCDTTQEPYSCEMGGTAVGCTDPTAYNYDATAIVNLYDDCQYPDTMNTDGNANTLPISTADDPNYFNVIAYEYDVEGEYVGLTNRAYTQVHTKKWTNIPWVDKTSEETKWSIEEDTSLDIPLDIFLNQGYSSHPIWNNAQVLVWEFDTEYMDATSDFRKLFEDTSARLWPKYFGACSDSPMNGLQGGNASQIDSDSISCFHYQPNSNWNGTQRIFARARVLTQDSMIFSNFNNGPETINTNGTNYLRSINISKNSPFKIVIWARNTQRQFAVKISKGQGDEYNPGFDYNDSIFLNLGEINYNNEHSTEGLRPYVFEVTEDLIRANGANSFIGNYHFLIQSVESLNQDEEITDFLQVATEYWYHYSDADYVTERVDLNLNVIPVPDAFEYIENNNHPIPESIDVQAANAQGHISFDMFAGKVCSDSKFECNDEVITQFLTSEIKINPYQSAVGETFPTTSGLGDIQNLRYTFYHNEESITKKTYLTVSTKDAEGGLFVALNGQVRQIDMTEGVNFDIGENMFNVSMDTQTFEFELEENALLFGENLVEFWRVTDGGQLLRFIVWQKNDELCPIQGELCESWGSIRDYDVVADGDTSTLADCVNNNICNEDSTLTQLGLMFYDYFLSFNHNEIKNILYPNEIINGVLFQSSVQDYQSFYDNWEQNSDSEFVLQGFRNTDNECCTPYGDYPDFDCIESLQTRFKVNDMAPIIFNEVDNPNAKYLPDYNMIEQAGSSKWAHTYDSQCQTSWNGLDTVYALPEFADKRRPSETIQADAVRPLRLHKNDTSRWSTGHNCFVYGGSYPGQDGNRWQQGSVSQGHHAKWIESEQCLTNGACISMMNRNTKYYPATGYDPDLDPGAWSGIVHYEEDGTLYIQGTKRWMGINQKISNNLAISHPELTQGTEITISGMAKKLLNPDTTDGSLTNSGIALGLYHSEWNPDTSEYQNTFGLSQNDNSSEENRYLQAFYEFEAFDKWQKFERTFVVDEHWNLDGGMWIYIYGHYGSGFNDFLIDNLQVNIAPTSGFVFEDDLTELPPMEKYYYNHFAMSANVLNSPLTFCDGDKILKESQFGFGSTAYDAIISPQPSLFEVKTSIKRQLVHSGCPDGVCDPGVSPISSWQLGIKHQNMGILEGTILSASPGVLNTAGKVWTSDGYSSSQVVTDTDNTTGFKHWIENTFETGIPLSHIMTTFNNGAPSPSNEHRAHQKARGASKVKYLPIPIEFHGETPSNNFHFNSFIFDTVGCVDVNQYTWPAPQHIVQDGEGTNTSKILPAFTSQKWVDIESGTNIDSNPDGTNYFFSTQDTLHKTLDEQPNSRWVEFAKHQQGDYNTSGWQHRLLDNTGKPMLYDYGCADINYIDYDNPDWIGVGTCMSSTGADIDADIWPTWDFDFSSENTQTQCVVNHISKNVFWDTYKQSWDIGTAGTLHDTYGGCCRTRTGPRIGDRFINGTEWVVGNPDNDGMWEGLRYGELYEADGEYYNLVQNVNVEQAGFYHAPLAITLRNYTQANPFSKLETVYPQPLDFPEQYPSEVPFEVTMSYVGYSNEFENFYNRYDTTYPRREEVYEEKILDALGISDEKVKYSAESKEIQENYGIRYKIEMLDKPRIKHKYASDFTQTSYDGVSSVLPFYEEGLPFFVDDIYVAETVIAYNLNKPGWLDEGNGQCVGYEQATCPAASTWMNISADGSEDEYCCWSTVTEFTYSEAFSQTINILDANPPKIHNITYSENAHSQVGVQLGEIIEYDLVGTNLISQEYLDANSYNGRNAIGGIDFTQYDLGDNTINSTYIAVGTAGSDELQVISDVFTIEQDSVWYNVIDAVNNGYEGVQTHRATLADNIQPQVTDGVFKTVIIESLYPGEEFNGTLNWGISDSQVNQQPLFSPLVNGETYPVIPIYEDFEWIDLEILASDIDKNTKLTFQVDTENEYILSASIHDYVFFNENLGDTEFDEGGDGVVDLEGNEASASARIRLFTYPTTYEEILNEGEDIETIETVPLIPHFNGTLDFVIRAMDNATLFDSYKMVLDVKPVNDPPLMEIIGDKEVYMNNITFPTELSVPIQTVDVEEGKNTLNFESVKEVNSAYCDNLQTAVDTILSSEGTDANGNVTECSNRFECRNYCGPWDSELVDSINEPDHHICDFADFNNDNEITQKDVDDCRAAVALSPVSFRKLELTDTPHWVDTLATYQGQTWAEHLDFEQQFSPDDFNVNWNNLNPKKYLKVETEYDTYGFGTFRIKATDNGLNEIGQIDEIRTGYTTGSIHVKPINKEGPTGEILAIEYASLGVTADTYLYNALGEEVRDLIPDKTSLTNSVKLTTYGYHSFTETTPDGMLGNCGNLGYEVNGIQDPGFVNIKGECCSIIPTTGINGNSDNFLSAFWNNDKKYWYEEDFNDAVSDYVNYVSYFMEAPYSASFGNQVCGFNVEESSNDYTRDLGPYSVNGEEVFNANVGGYVTPNQELNPADRVVSYKLEVEDVVDSYDTATLIQSSSNIDVGHLFDGFELDEFGNMNTPWADKWNALAQEGWPTSGSNNPNYGRVVYKTPTVDAISEGSRIIEEGFVYRFDYPSVFLITVFATDEYGFTGRTTSLVDARNLVYLKQTLLNQYSPWQGMNITGSQAVENTITDMESRDKDERKSLGLFYPEEFQPVSDWNIKYGNSYRGLDGNWINSFPIDYYYGDAYNKIQFSENFDNKYIRADVGEFFNNDNGAIYYGIMRDAFPNYQWPSVKANLDEDVLSEMVMIAEQIRNELGETGVALFNAWSTGQIELDILPVGVQTLIQSIQNIMTEPLVVATTTLKALEEESSVESYDVDENGNSVEFTTVCASTNQNSTATLDCGEGKSIKRVIFDSYGLPTGECGVYGINSECHCTPTDSLDWINKRSVTVSATDSLCGDPCNDLSKYRYVQVECGYDRYNRWYKGGRFFETPDYASISEGVEAYDNKVAAPDKILLETEKDDKAYLIYQQDAYSDYYGRYYCDIDYSDEFFNNSYYKLPSEWSTITADGSDAEQDSGKSYNEYFIADETECKSMCHWRDYTPSNNTCTLEYEPADRVAKVNFRECTQSWIYSSNQSPCSRSTCDADVQIECNEYQWNYHHHGYTDNVCVNATCADYGYRYKCEGSGFHFNHINKADALSMCQDNCYTKKTYNLPDGDLGDNCQEINSDNAQSLDESSIIDPYSYYLGQNNLVEAVDRERTDRIFSVYMRPFYDEDRSGTGGNASITSKASQPEKSSIIFRAVADYLPSDEEVNLEPETTIIQLLSSDKSGRRACDRVSSKARCISVSESGDANTESNSLTNLWRNADGDFDIYDGSLSDGEMCVYGETLNDTGGEGWNSQNGPRYVTCVEAAEEVQRAVGFSDYGTTEIPTDIDSRDDGLFYYGYSNKMDIIWSEIEDGTSIWYSPEMHPEYPDIPLWGVEEFNIDSTDSITDEPRRGVWYRFWMRVVHDKNISEYKTEIYPGGIIPHSEASVFLWGTSVQEIKPYEEIELPYQSTRFTGEVSVYDFVPDVDVRTISSADGFKSRLYEYYDSELQPGKYQETSAPLSAQLYFYLRNPYDQGLFQSKDIIDYPQNTLYVGFIDWGDGTAKEYSQEPFEVKSASVLTHTFEESGTYEIKGEIFNVARDTNGIVLGIGTFYTFLLRINVNINKEIEGEFQLLGGEKYTFIPYQHTFPVVSGVSPNSIYSKTIKRNLGYMTDDPTNKINVPFTYHGDEMKTEQALTTIDERFIGPTVSAYTGSYPSQSGLSDEDTVEIYGGSDACELVVEGDLEQWVCTSTQEVFDSPYVCGQNCHDYEEARFAPKGFYEGNVDNITGQLVPQGQEYFDENGVTQINEIIPKLINKGFDLYPGELGDFLGDTDIAQLRYFDKPIDMWELLGFPCMNATGNSTINYLSPELNLWEINDADTYSHSSVVPELDFMFDSSHTFIANSESATLKKTITFPLGPGYEGVFGKTFTFSFYVKKHQNFDITDMNIYAKISTAGGSEFIVEDVVTLNWKRISITGTFEENIDEGFEDRIDIEIGTDTVDTIYMLMAPQLQRNELSDYRLSNSPVLEGTCTEAPGGNPGDEKYYKNIVPETQQFLHREGIEVGWNGELFISESSPQTWNGVNQYGNSFYYPVLPKLNKLGKSEETLQSNLNGTENIPFGSLGRTWNVDDSKAVATNTDIYSSGLMDDCLLDIDFGEENDQALEDLSGNTNIAIFIGDYRIEFNSVTMRPKKGNSFRTMIVGEREQQKAY